MKILGVDTGGTFTDFVYFSTEKGGDATVRLHKLLSTPKAPEEAILQGIAEMGIDARGLLLVHGSTVATNAVLEGAGVACAYITNRGFGDVLTLGRQARRELYNITPMPEAPPVPESWCFETGGRLSASGEVLEGLSDDDISTLREQIDQSGVEAVAINLLFSFLDSEAEERIAASLPDGIFVSRSSAVLSEYREYERGMATWLNAYVGPLMQGYLGRLCRALPEAHVMVMQSHGGSMSASRAGQHAVELLLSGPAGGLVGAQYQGRASGVDRVMTFDMGGTSSDVALIDGEIQLTNDSEIAGYPVAVPMVDMHTIGAGGGSIAWVDEGGLLQVGPQSAGATPGPACYGQGGQQPTVTDANLLLGRLPASVSLGGYLQLDPSLAENAIGAVARELGLGLIEAAEGIISIANEHMAQALRVISVQRGYNPADFTLMSFGGAGGLHVCGLAERLGMRRVLVPRHGGVLSALGMVVAPVARIRTQTWICHLESLDAEAVELRFNRLADSLIEELRREGVDGCQIDCSTELRYVGQSSTLRVNWRGDIHEMVSTFHSQHREEFGHDLDISVELVTLRVRAEANAEAPKLPRFQTIGDGKALDRVEVNGETDGVPVCERDSLVIDQALRGPAIIIEQVSTTWLARGWCATPDAAGNLLLERDE